MANAQAFALQDRSVAALRLQESTPMLMNATSLSAARVLQSSTVPSASIAVRPAPVAATAVLAANPATMAAISRPARISDVFIDPQRRIDIPPVLFRGVPRTQLQVPVAPSATPADTDAFESPDGTKHFVLPRYSVALDKVGSVDEPRIAIADRSGTPTLIITLLETPSPAVAPNAAELEHVLAVTLKYRAPVLDGGSVVQELAFPTVLLDSTQTVVTAELPLTTPGQRQQVLAALASRDAAATLVVGRGATVGVPTGQNLPDGSPGYRVRRVLLDWAAPPAPVLLSESQSVRLGGGASAGSIQPLIRRRIRFGDRTYSYWQDPARPECFFFLPDRFLLARMSDGDRAPMLKVRAANAASEDELRVTLEFHAHPVLDPARLDAARNELEGLARALGATMPIQLDILPDPQPLLRLALPQGGAPAAGLTERRGTDIDLETGLTQAETLTLPDFQLVYEALFGASLSLLRGEIRVAGGSTDPEDIPLELRLDNTVGDVLSIAPSTATQQGIPCRITNSAESPVRLNRLAAYALCGGKRLTLRIDGVEAGRRLAPGEAVDAMLVSTEPLPPTGVDTILLDQTGVAVEPDRAALWARIFDRSAPAQLTRSVTVEAVGPLFASPDRPNDKVAAFVVTVEHGGTVRLTEAELVGAATVHVPVEPLLTGAPLPPIRYRTETWWASGGIGTSPWRETDSTILLPVKTAPAAT
jgi:hypothetical protein